MTNRDLKKAKCLECSGTRCEDIYIYIYIKTHLCSSSSCCSRSDDCLKDIPRDSYCGRLLMSRNFGDSSEIVLVVS